MSRTTRVQAADEGSADAGEVRSRASGGAHDPPVHVAVALTVHNRRDTTLRCLRALLEAGALDGLRLSVVLTDDGSTDGTADAVRDAFPDVRVITGDGSLFWNRGMRLALEAARATEPDYLLWLNDDTMLEPGALDRLLDVAASLRRQNWVLAASVREPGTDVVSYGGRRRGSWHPFNFDELVTPSAEAVLEVDVFNGNVVLVPTSVHDRIGNLDAGFSHAYGDFEYGLRARKRGVGVLLAPGTFGTCRREDQSPRANLARPFVEEMRDFATNPKRNPFSDAWRYYTLHAPVLLRPLVVVPYLKHALRYFTARLRARAGQA